MRIARSLVLVIGVTATTGCEETFLGPYDLDELTFVLTIVGSEPVETRFAGGVGTIAVRSYHATPMCGYELSGSVAQGTEGLEILIEADFVGGIAVACYYTYEAVVGGLPPGLHAVTVIHHVESGMRFLVAADKVRVR